MGRERRKSERRSQRDKSAEERRASDRRKSERRLDTRVSLALWVRQEHGQEMVLNRTVDLSPGGVQLDMGFPPPAGTRLTLRFALPNDTQEIVAQAEVVRGAYDLRPRTHLKFVDLAGNDFVRIQHFIDSQS